MPSRDPDRLPLRLIPAAQVLPLGQERHRPQTSLEQEPSPREPLLWAQVQRLAEARLKKLQQETEVSPWPLADL